MNKSCQTIASAVLLVGLLFLSPAPVAAQTGPSATFTVSYDNAGLIIGWHSGDGVLRLNDGSEYAFTLDAYSFAGLGYAKSKGTGKVWNLRQASDLSGQYFATGGGTSFGQGDASLKLKNDRNNVRVDLVSKQTGLRVGFGAGSVGFKLGKMLKGPRKPAPVAKAPVQVVKTAPMPKPVMIKPTEYTMQFGFNKSRVSLAMGRTLDAILADWKDKPVTFRVVGHADMMGGKRYNMKLSQKRANAVKRAMQKRGIAASRISAKGVGQADLAVKTKKGKRLRANRRVIIQIIK